MSERQEPALPDRTASNPVADHLGFLLRRCQVAVFDDFARAVRAFDLRPSDYSVLSVVRQNGGIRPSRLGEMLGIKLANLSPLLDRLEARGLLRRRRAPEDQRAIELSLSRAGRRLAVAVDQAVGGHVETMRCLLGASEYDRLVAGLKRLLDALDGAPAARDPPLSD